MTETQAVAPKRTKKDTHTPPPFLLATLSFVPWTVPIVSCLNLRLSQDERFLKNLTGNIASSHTKMQPESGNVNKTWPPFAVVGLSDVSFYALQHFPPVGPRGLIFTWFGCCGLCLWHKPAELAHSLLVCFCVDFCLYSPFIFHPINFPDNFPLFHSVLPVLFLPYICPFNYIYRCESLSKWSCVVFYVNVCLG